MGKIDRHGQAAILSLTEQNKILAQLNNPSHKLLFRIAIATGERWGAICQLKVSDAYADPIARIPRKEITFRAQTRKAAPDGKRITRQVPVSGALAEALRSFKPPIAGFLFPSPKGDAPISFQAADKFLRNAVAKARLSHKGISTHSTRRTAITRLYEAGIGVMEIKAITGHKSLAALMRYIEVSPDRVAAALAVLG